MARGWLVCPVIGSGTEDDSFRGAVADREAIEGDRIDYVIDPAQPTCLAAFDVPDGEAGLKRLEAAGGEILSLEGELGQAI